MNYTHPSINVSVCQAIPVDQLEDGIVISVNVSSSTHVLMVKVEVVAVRRSVLEDTLIINFELISIIILTAVPLS